MQPVQLCQQRHLQAEETHEDPLRFDINHSGTLITSQHVIQVPLKKNLNTIEKFTFSL